ncbi:MAG: hypothetical protein J5379_10545 [Clostridiales bacterium]|nr:hypothetical protein [Clostridiales bacterium]
MHTLEASIVYSILLITLCGFVAMHPLAYSRTEEIARLSVSCQDEDNKKDSIFEVRTKSSVNNRWNVEIGCPEKAYRLGKGMKDSLAILLG